MGYANEFLNKRFGGNVASNDNPITTTVQTTKTKIAYNNGDRVSIYIVNLGDKDIFIMFDESVSLTNGFKITSNGGTLGFNVKDDGELPTREWWAIADTAESTIFLTEGVVK